MPFLRLSLLVAFLVLAGCQVAPIMGVDVDDLQLKEGVYKGSYRNGPNRAVVKVTIADNRIADVELVRHFSSWKGSKANVVIPKRIKARQSTRVDVVSGATNSSIVIMNAAQKAVEKAYE